MSLPDRLLLYALLRRSLVTWVGLRLAFFAASSGAQTVFGPPSLFVRPLAALGIVCLVGGLVLLDVRRRREHAFLANLGISQAVITSIAAVAALAAEICVAAARAS